LIIEKNAPMELVITTSHRVYDTLGGVEKFVSSFSSWCEAKGNLKVTVISRSLSIIPIKITNGAVLRQENGEIKSVKKVKLPFQLYYLGLVCFSFASFLALTSIVKKSRQNKGKAVILHSQDMNFAAIPAVLVGKLFKIPVVIHQHGPYQKLLPSRNMRIIEQAINRITCSLSDIIIATDKFTSEYVRNIVGDDKKIVIIPAAIDTSLFEGSSNNFPIDNNCFKIGYIGRLSAEKNLETLLYAFKEFKLIESSPSRLILVGDGELREKLKQLAIKIGINEFVTFTGFQTNIKPILSSLDVFVLPSKVEGTPISLIEAMAAGKAIIVSNIPPIREIVESKKEALIFNSNNYMQLKDQMYTLFKDSEFRNKIGRNAKNKSKQYDAERVFLRILQCYTRLQKPQAGNNEKTVWLLVQNKEIPGINI
jgi:glycosyltransferase involved in cell wall biosynthesis